MSKRELYYKILILGDSSVGKTCFLTRYADDRFEDTHIATTGMDYKLKNITLENGKTVKLQIWDTLGQDRFRSITKNYYKGAHGIILIYDITERKTFESVSNWVKTIRDEADEKVVIVLAANKECCNNGSRDTNCSNRQGIERASSCKGSGEEYYKATHLFRLLSYSIALLLFPV